MRVKYFFCVAKLVDSFESVRCMIELVSVEKALHNWPLIVWFSDTKIVKWERMCDKGIKSG